MGFISSLTPEDLHTYHSAVTRSVTIRNHFDAFVWLQGDMQRFIPHDILIAAWGNFHDDVGVVHHDIVSAMPGVRSNSSDHQTITPLLLALFRRWTSLGCTPFTLNTSECGFLLQDTGLKCAVGQALQTMQSVLVHGVNDERGSHDCMYVFFSLNESFNEDTRQAMAVVLPYIDMALRQVEHLPHQGKLSLSRTIQLPQEEGSSVAADLDISVREAEVLQWVALGKTNPEIGAILAISEFTVKNHMQRVFKKLDVCNRVQAVSKYRAMLSHV